MYSFNGCPHHCFGCHNPETWSLLGGELFNIKEVIKDILDYIGANGIQRNLSILGGEPLWGPNAEFTKALAAAAKKKYPTIKIFCWTGYLLEDIDEEYLKDIDVLIDGPFQIHKRDVTLPLRGSSNQRILYNKIDFCKNIEERDE